MCVIIGSKVRPTYQLFVDMLLNCMTNSVVNGVCHASNFKDTKRVIEDRMRFDVKIHNLH